MNVKFQLKSEDVVQAYIERINEVNPTLNAVVDFRFEDAIKEAKDVDAFLQETNLTKEELKAQKPFLGVPFTSKESTSAKGKLIINNHYSVENDQNIMLSLNDRKIICGRVLRLPIATIYMIKFS